MLTGNLCVRCGSSGSYVYEEDCHITTFVIYIDRHERLSWRYLLIAAQRSFDRRKCVDKGCQCR